MTRERKQQFTLRISQANSTELVVILYEMLLCYIDECKAALGAESEGEFKEAVRKSRGCLNELMASLNMDYEISKELLQLYIFCIRRLARAEVKKDGVILDEIKKVIKPLHKAYREVAVHNTQGPVMNNSQRIYAGLTYGRNTLTENMVYQSANRGVYA